MKEVILAALPAAIPTLTVLIALLINQVAINRLASEIVDLRKQSRDDFGVLRSEINSEINSIRSDLNSLCKQLHDDIVMLIGRDTEKSERLARLEERSKS